MLSVDSEKIHGSRDECLLLEGVRDYEILQQADGGRAVTLKGSYAVSSPENYPVLRVFQEDTGIYVEPALRPEFAKGSWQAELFLEAGHVYRIEAGICMECTGFDMRFLGRGSIVREVGVGEIFVIAGQSNAAGYGQQTVSDRPHVLVHMKNADGSWALAAHPLAHVNPPRTAANSDILNSGHSAWLAMARMIAESGMPVGLIMTALNGSGIGQWAPGMPLYENLMAQLTESGAAHVIWYQGCTDVYSDLAVAYAGRLRQLLRFVMLRAKDCYVIQIAGTTNGNSPHGGWAAVREAQRQVSAQVGAFLIPTYDLTDFSDDIHLSAPDNLLLARRVYETYVRGSCLEVSASYEAVPEPAVVLWLNRELSSAVACSDFSIGSGDGRWHRPIRAVQEQKQIRLYSNVTAPAAVRLNFGRLYDGGKKTGELLPYFNIKI